MSFSARSGLLLLAGLTVPGVSQAGSIGERWFVRVGGARMSTGHALTARAHGSPLPGAEVQLTARYAAAVEIGHYIVPTLVVSLSAGTPVRQPVIAAGVIRPYGILGKVAYGPAAFAVQWRPLPRSPIKPYVGAGLAYLHVFDISAGALGGFRFRDDLGPLVQGGAELMMARRLGIFADARKSWITSSTGGSLGQLPINARLKLNPVILSAGATFHL